MYQNFKKLLKNSKMLMNLNNITVYEFVKNGEIKNEKRK